MRNKVVEVVVGAIAYQNTLPKSYYQACKYIRQIRYMHV